MDTPIRDPETSTLTPSEAVHESDVPWCKKLPSIDITLQMARLALAPVESADR
tara:strand:- start:211 stop:369 length:159 start_codon:yes stop_codon:yes gene_type:complete